MEVCQDKLFRDDEKYAGKFVITASFSDTVIVGSADTIKSAREIARTKGYDNPVVTKIPKKNSLLLF